MSSDVIVSITKSPAFSFLVMVVVIILTGIIYYLLEKYVFSKMRHE